MNYSSINIITEVFDYFKANYKTMSSYVKRLYISFLIENINKVYRIFTNEDYYILNEANLNKLNDNSLIQSTR